jgi:cell division cycle protein 20 (cofactor of APC complex)
MTSCLLSPKTILRSIPAGPCRILDAPELMDDYYLNLLSWGYHNAIAVALRRSVYLWHASDGKIIKLLTLEEDDQYVTSVNWAPTDNTLAVGTSNNVVQLWDTTTLKLIRTLEGHTNRVSSLSWNSNNTLSSGSRDSSIINHDIRQSTNIISTFHGHNQEVCGLAWSPDGTTLASGGNEVSDMSL